MEFCKLFGIYVKTKNIKQNTFDRIKLYLGVEYFDENLEHLDLFNDIPITTDINSVNLKIMSIIKKSSKISKIITLLTHINNGTAVYSSKQLNNNNNIDFIKFNPSKIFNDFIDFNPNQLQINIDKTINKSLISYYDSNDIFFGLILNFVLKEDLTLLFLTQPNEIMSGIWAVNLKKGDCNILLPNSFDNS